MKRLLITLVLILAVVQTGFSRNDPDSFQRMGYKGYVETGYRFGFGDLDANCFEFINTHGFQINPYLYIGTGYGLHLYFLQEDYYGYTYNYNDYVIPIFTDFRVNFKKGRVVPFAVVKGGYSFSTEDTFRGAGAYASTSVGVKYMFNRRNGVNVNLGYTYQQYRYEYYSGRYYFDITENMHGIGLNIGFEF